MPAGYVHTIYKDGSWTNTVEDDDSSRATFETKDKAVSAGRKLAMDGKTEHVIHNQDGEIAERNSYGQDSVSRPG